MTAAPTTQFTNSLFAALAFWKQQAAKRIFSALDNERHNLVRAVEMGLVLSETQLPAIETALGAFQLVYARGYWWEWLPILETAIETCPYEQSQLKFDLYNRYGDLLRFCGYPSAAVTAHESALVLAAGLNEPGRLGEAHARLGLAFRDMGQFETAEHHCHEALSHLELGGDAGLSLVASVRAILGRMALRRGALPEAESNLRQAVTIWRQLSDSLRLAQGLNDLGMVFRESNEFDTAEQHYREAMQLLVGEEYKMDYISIQYSLGVLLFSQQLWSEAEAVFREIDLDYLRQTGNVMFEAKIITALGNTTLYKGRADKAVSLLQRGVTLWGQLDDKEELANAVGSLGEALAANGDREAAQAQFLEALAQLDQLPDRPRVIRLRALFTAELQKLGTCKKPVSDLLTSFFD